MRIAILGAGNVGTALGIGWSRAGHDIVFGVRDPSDPKARLSSEAAGSAAVTNVATAAGEADVIVLAVPWEAVPAVIGDCGSLAGKTLIDATNPLRFGENGLALALGFSTSGSEEVARLAIGASVFKTMNQVGFEVMSNATGYPTRPVTFVAGDDEASRLCCGWWKIWVSRASMPAL